MTNEEFYNKKIDEEYQKYLKSLKVPSKEEWLKMEYKEEIHHKFNVGDIIRDNRDCNDCNHYLITLILPRERMYQLKSIDTGMTHCKDIDFVDSFCSFFI